MGNTDYGEQDAQLWFATRTSGVYVGNHLGVFAHEGMELRVSPGIAWLKHSDFGGLVYANTLDAFRTIDIADASFDRIDRITIRYDVVGNVVLLAVKKGTPAFAPQPPALTRNASAFELSIAQVRVRRGALEILPVDITDERLNPEVCGIMSDGVTGIDLRVMNAQFDGFMAELGETLSGDVAGNLLNLINQEKTTREAAVTELAAGIASTNRDTYLWGNASFYSPFATQTIPLNLTAYDTVVVDFCFNPTNAEYRERMEFVKLAPAAATLFDFEGKQALRYVFSDNNGVYFGTGSLRPYNVLHAPANDLCMVPIRIWGRKMGV